MIMILHAMLNASSGPLWRAIPEYSTLESTSTALITYVYLLQAAALWVAAVAVVLFYGASNLSRKPRQVLFATGAESREPRKR
jgi:hypothetical protein